MDSLQAEFERLYRADVDAPGSTRAMVLEIAAPASWSVLSKVWRGVQSDLDLPAPAIAVTGKDGLALWFSLGVSVESQRALSFLRGLSRLYLADVASQRIRSWPSATSTSFEDELTAMAPGREVASERWSAFIAPDLAPIFDDTPWLDIEPGREGQANILRELKSVAEDKFELAMSRLAVEREDKPAIDDRALATAAPRASDRREEPASSAAARAFLWRVMNDEQVEMAHRIEAAKALLCSDGA